MPINGLLTLANVETRFLDVTCLHCPRYGFLSVARLIEEYGLDMTLDQLRCLLPGKCPKREAPIWERCIAQYQEQGICEAPPAIWKPGG